MSNVLRVASLLVLFNVDIGASAINVARTSATADKRVQPDGIQARIIIGAAPAGENALSIQEAVQGFEFQIANGNWRSDALRNFLIGKGVSPDVALPAPLTSVDVQVFPESEFVFSPAPGPAPALAPGSAPAGPAAPPPSLHVVGAPAPGLMAAPMPGGGFAATFPGGPSPPAPAPLPRGAARAADLTNAMRAIITTTTGAPLPQPGAEGGGGGGGAPLPPWNDPPAPAAIGQPGTIPVMEIPASAYDVEEPPPSLEIRIGTDGQEMECTGRTCTQFRDGATIVVPPEEVAAATPASSA